MSRLSDLSDDQLLAAYHAKTGGGELSPGEIAPRVDPSAPESSDESPLASMSDAELMMIHSMMSKPQAQPKPKPVEVLNVPSLTQWDPAITAAAQMDAEQQGFRQFQVNQNNLPPTNRAVGGLVQGAADALAPLTQGIVNTFPMVRGARDESKQLGSKAGATKANADAAGILEAVDAIANLAPGWAVSGLLGSHIKNEHGAVDLAGKLKQLTGGTQMEAEAPNYYGVTEGTAGLAAPLPGMGNIVGHGADLARILPKGAGAAKALGKLAQGVDDGKVLPTLANMGTEGALINALLAQGAKKKEGKDASPQELGESALYGLLGGVGIGAVAKGAEGAVKGIAKLPEHIRAAQAKASAPTAKDANAIARVNAKRQQVIEQLLADNPDNEDLKAVLNARGQIVHPDQAQRSAQHALDSIDFDTTPQAVQSARNAQANIDYSTTPPPPKDPWTVAIENVRNATDDAARVTALREAEKLRKKQIQGLPKTDTRKQLSKKLQAELTQADQYNRGRKTVAPVENNVLAPKRRQDVANEELARDQQQQQQPQPSAQPAPPQQAAPSWKDHLKPDEPAAPPRNDRPVEPGTGLLRDRPEPTTPAPKSHGEIEAEQFPKAFEPLATDGRTGRHIYAKSLGADDIENSIEHLNTELERPSNKLKNGNPKDNETTRELRRQLEVLQHEKLRREYRKNKGVEPDHPVAETPKAKHPSEMTDEELLEAFKNLPEDADHVAALDAEYSRRNEAPAEPQHEAAPEPQPEPQPEPPKGMTEQPPETGRTRYTTQTYGRKRITDGDEIHVNDLADHPDLAPHATELKGRVETLVQNKAELDRLKATEEGYFKSILDHFGSDSIKAHGVEIKRNELSPEPNREMEARLNKHRQELSEGVNEGAIPETAGVTLADKLESQHDRLPKPTGSDPNSPENAAVFKAAKEVRGLRIKADDKVKGSRNFIKEPIKKAQETYQAKQSRKMMVTADGKAPDIHYDGEIKLTPSEQQVTGGVEHVNAKDQLKLSPEAEEKFNAFKEAQKAGFPEMWKKVQSFTLKTLSTKKGKSALGVGGLISSLVAGTEAQAAETAQAVAQHSNMLWDALAHVGPEATALVAAMKMGPATAKKLLDDKSPVGMLGQILWNDTMDKIGQLDKFMGTNLAKDIWTKHFGRVYEASFGVHFDGNQRQEGLAALREGLTANEALSGKAGTPFEKMNADQREAVVVYHAMQKEIGKSIRAQKKAFEEKLAQGNHGLDENRQISFWRDALNHIEQSLNPQSTNFVEKGASYVIGNFADYHFFWNPKFHATNLMDQWITGGLRVGLGNIAEANRLLMPGVGDKDLASAFKVSNFTGGLTEERVAQGVATKAKINVNDIPSDKINADRVMLGAALQKYHGLDDATKAMLKGQGINNHVDFAKALFLGNTKLDATLAMETFGHMAEVGSRTLGVDPYRLNVDTLSMKGAKAFTGIFLRQPARMARIVMNELAQGNFKRIALITAGMVTVAGSAALPAEVRYLWDALDKDDWRKVRDFLDDAALVKNNAKHEWATLLYPLMAANTNIIDEGRDAIKAGKDAYKFALKSTADALDGELDGKEFLGGMAKVGSRLAGAIGSVAMPRIGGVIPTRMVAQAGKTAERLTNDEISVYPENNMVASKGMPRGKKFAPGDLGMSPLDVIMDPISMGEHAGVARARRELSDENRDKESGDDDENISRIARKVSSGDLFKQLAPSQNRR